MMWFITKLRNTAIFGSVRISLPFDINVQGLNKASSLAPAIAALASAEFASNIAKSSASDFGNSAGGSGLPSGARSNESDQSHKPPTSVDYSSALPARPWPSTSHVASKQTSHGEHAPGFFAY